MTFHQELQELGGLWQHKEGNRYLAQLASGRNSDTYCNLGVLTTRPDRLEFWAQALVREIRSELSELSRELVVIGPGMGGITLAYEIAKHLHTSGGTQAYFTEPVEVGGEKLQKLRFDIPASADILMTEDVITTGGSVQKTFNAINEKGFGSMLNIVACLVDRRAEKGPLRISFLCTGGALEQALSFPAAGAAAPLSMKVVSLLSITPRTWDTLADAQKDCPAAISAIKPKANWRQLVEG